MNLTDISADVCDLATRIDNALPERLHAMRDAMSGQPRAQNYQHDGSSHVWCWWHERDVKLCHAEDLNCTGETIEVHDPTGEAAVTFDPARAHRRELERCLKAAQKSLDRAAGILVLYQDAELTSDRAGIGKCADCGHYCTGERNDRLSAYRGESPICATCRARRDRAQSA